MDRNYYLNESDITRAYRQFMQDLTLALTNDTSMISNDVNAVFEFEKLISKVIFYTLIILFASLLSTQYIWTSAEQTAREEENVRITISNLSSAINASVSISLILVYSSSFCLV